MLNTALHNPNVAARRGRPAAITQEQFVRQNRGVDGGRDLPRDVLEMIYRSIRDEPFRIPEESYDDLMYTFFSPEREGWLVKQGGRWVLECSLPESCCRYVSLVHFAVRDKENSASILKVLTTFCSRLNWTSPLFETNLYPFSESRARN